MADLENAGGSDVLATAEPHETSELGFVCGVACIAAGILAVSLSVALPLILYLTTTTTTTPVVLFLRGLAWAGLLAATLGVAVGALYCCDAGDLCLHGDRTGERQKTAPPPVHEAMD